MKIITYIYQHININNFSKLFINIFFLIIFASCNQKSDHTDHKIIFMGLSGSSGCPGGIILADENTKTKSYLIIVILHSDAEIFIDPNKKHKSVIKINGLVFHYEINHLYILDKKLNIIDIQKINKKMYDKFLSEDFRNYNCTPVLSKNSYAGQVPIFEKEGNDFGRKFHRAGSSANGEFGADWAFFQPEFRHSDTGHPPAQGQMNGNAGIWKLQAAWRK